MEVWPAPFEGVMSDPVVRAIGELGLVEQWMTPFLRVTTAVPRAKILREFAAPYAACRIPYTVQIMGVDPEIMAGCAAEMLALGARGINVNFGCPSRQVTNGGAGGGGLKNPGRMVKILSKIRQTVGNAPLSVKMRSGFNDPAECRTILPELGMTDMIFFHFRTVKEQYLQVPGREERFQQAIAAAGNIPVVINGDINSAAEARELTGRLPAAGVMCGRGFFRDPYLLRRIKGETMGPAAEAAERLYQTVLALAPDWPAGKKIELGNLIWGSANPYFRQLTQKI